VGSGSGGEKREDAALKFFGLVAEGGSVEGVGDYPKLFWSRGSSENAAAVAAGQRSILAIANE